MPTDQRAPVRRILIVDDDEFIRRLAMLVLHGAGYQADSAGDAGQALRLLEAAVYDLILMDCILPDMDGDALVSRYRQHEQGRGLARRPVIAFTGNTDRAYHARLIAAGMDDVLPKPLSAPALLAKIAAWSQR